MNVQWPDRVDEILDGDAVVIFATVTAAGGVVLSPLSNFGLRDRQAVSSAFGQCLGCDKKEARSNQC